MLARFAGQQGLDRTHSIVLYPQTGESIMINIKVFIVFSLLLFCSQTTVAQILFAAPPRENSETAKLLYEPIAEQLTRIIGQKVTYEQPRGWADYTKKMREGKYDIVFDGPHFTAWRLKNLKHIPVATLPGTLDFYIIAHNKENFIDKAKDLVGKSICAMPSPNLATDMVYDMFPNPVIQPIFYEVTGGMEMVFDAFTKGHCDATVIRRATFNSLSKQQRGQYRIVAKTRPLPNQTFTISDKLRQNHVAISDFLLSADASQTLAHLLARYSKNDKKLQKTNGRRYRGVEALLEGVVWGW